MGAKAVSLNLVLKKKGSPDALKSVPATVADMSGCGGSEVTNLPRGDVSETALGKYVPPAALEVFPDWQGVLINSTVLNMSVWVVRAHDDGLALAKETGHPALMLDDILKQKGKTTEEAREALLPILITVPQ